MLLFKNLYILQLTIQLYHYNACYNQLGEKMQISMFYTIAIIFALFMLWKIYQNIIKPYALMNYYKKQFKNKGYKYFSSKFIPFASESIFTMLKDQKQHNDSLYSIKYSGQDHDMNMFNLGNKILIFLRNPNLIKQLYSKDVSGEYKKDKQTIRGLARIIHNGLTFSQGSDWKTKRKYATLFLNYEFVNQQIPVICGIIDSKLSQFSNNQHKFSLQLLQLCEAVTSTTVIQLFFGGAQSTISNLTIQNKSIGKYIRQIISLLGKQLYDPLYMFFGMKIFQLGLKKRDKQVNKRIKLFQIATKQFIQQRIDQIKKGKSVKQDYISKIYELAPDQDRNADFISDLAHQFVALFAAGTDTTSHSMIMMIYYCILNPRVLKKLQEQISQIVRSQLTHQTLKKMKYLDLIFHETMRYYQPANGIFFRQAQYDHLLGDIKIKKGTLLSISSLTNHYHPEYYEDPSEFKPERWLNQDGSKKNPKPFTWLSFSSGPRGCVGKVLAQTQMKLMTIKFFQKYKISINQTQLKMKMEDFSYQPQKIITTFTKRQQ